MDPQSESQFCMEDFDLDFLIDPCNHLDPIPLEDVETIKNNMMKGFTITWDQSQEDPFKYDSMAFDSSIVLNSPPNSESTSDVMEIFESLPKIQLPTSKFPALTETSFYKNLGIPLSEPGTVVKKEPSDTTSHSTLCPICGNEAGRHVHYGGRSCNSCRAFFRRAVQNDGYSKFACRGGKVCKINSKSWKSCRWCRYHRCLSSGMVPGYVLNEAERQDRSVKRASSSLRLKKKIITNNKQTDTCAIDVPPTSNAIDVPSTFKVQSTSVVPDSSILAERSTAIASDSRIRTERSTTIVPYMGSPMASNGDVIMWMFSKDELNQLQTIIASWSTNLATDILSFFTRKESLFKGMIRALFYRTVLPYDTYQQLETFWTQLNGDMFVKNTFIGRLKPNDYKSLVEANLPVLRVFVQSVILGSSRKYRANATGELLMTLMPMHQPDQSTDLEINQLNQIMSYLNIEHGLPEKSISYEQVFSSPWAPSEDMEERHQQLTFQMCPWPIDNVGTNHQQVDKLQVFLLAHSIMLQTDYAKVNEMDKISKLQDMHLTMLHRYLKYKYNGSAYQKLSEGIMIISMAREAYHIRSQRLPV